MTIDDLTPRQRRPQTVGALCLLVTALAGAACESADDDCLSTATIDYADGLVSDAYDLSVRFRQRDLALLCEPGGSGRGLEDSFQLVCDLQGFRIHESDSVLPDSVWAQLREPSSDELIVEAEIALEFEDEFVVNGHGRCETRRGTLD